MNRLSLRRRVRLPLLLAISLLPAAVSFAADPPEAPMAIGSRRELFVDRALVETTRDMRLELQHPQPQEIVLACDKPWEGSVCGYFRVLKDGLKLRMWYIAQHWPVEPDETAPRHPIYVAYAESDDGLTWRKPNLGLYEFQGSKENNICCTDVVDNFTPMLDTNPKCPPESRYKAVGAGKGGLIAYQSPDGLNWKRIQDAPIITKGAFDSQNVVFWDAVANTYRAYIRG